MSHHHHRITPAVALTIALAAATASTALADPAPLARAEAAIANASAPPSAGSGPCSEVCSGGAGSYGSLNQPARTQDESGATLPHDPRPRSVALASGSNGSVNATARTPASPVSCGDVCSSHGWPVSAPATVLRIAAPSAGFDWGDAGIGAGATIALMLIGTGGVLATTHRRGRRAPQQRPSASS
jgi:hypothetical protein